jgi:Flp pilus assembly pilin Flp
LAHIPISIVGAKIATNNQEDSMLNYALVLALIGGVVFVSIGELGQKVKGGFDAVNTAIVLVEDINKKR